MSHIVDNLGIVAQYIKGLTNPSKAYTEYIVCHCIKVHVQLWRLYVNLNMVCFFAITAESFD